jgi:hypothetical protein
MKVVPLVSLLSVLDVTECLMLYLNSPPSIRILSQLNHFHTLKQHLVEIYLIKFLPSIHIPPSTGVFPSGFQNNTLHKFLIVLVHAIRPHRIITFHFIFLVHQKLTKILKWSETFNVFSFNTGIVASNSTPNTVNICLFSVYVLSSIEGDFQTPRFPAQGILPKITNKTGNVGIT